MSIDRDNQRPEFFHPADPEGLMRSYPELQVHFELFDRQIGLVQDNIDLDIRINNDIPEYCPVVNDE